VDNHRTASALSSTKELHFTNSIPIKHHPKFIALHKLSANYPDVSRRIFTQFSPHKKNYKLSDQLWVLSHERAPPGAGFSLRFQFFTLPDSTSGPDGSSSLIFDIY